MKFFCALLLVGCIWFVQAIREQRGDMINIGEDEKCVVLTTCSECLQQEGCSWCSKPEYTQDGKPVARCNSVLWFSEQNDHFLEVSCSQYVIRSIANTTLKITEDKPLGFETNGNQLKPQRIRIETTPHTPVKFRIQFKRLANYPVDLYYLMDLSTSMKTNKDYLVKLSSSLATEMGSVTSDFRMGFGSFIDKRVYPFANENDQINTTPYLFQHHLKLSNGAQNFASQVQQAKTYNNLDSPEGGLEALMQTVVCTQQIGWRNNSHRLLIFSTDGPYHIAGDGKLAGIVSPNDENCYVTERNGQFTYDKFKLIDYPSIAQINRQIAKNAVNVIFAVPESVEETYRDLSNRLYGTTVGRLTDGSNIVKLIQEQYNKISSIVTMSHRASDRVQVKYSSSCTGQQKDTNRCDHVTRGSTVEFDVTVTVVSCRNSMENSIETIEFFPMGVNEVVTVEVNVSCHCTCDHNYQGYECNGHGIFQCGYCKCNSKFSGPFCECSNADQQDSTKVNGCIPPKHRNSSISLIRECSGRGRCNCGKNCTCYSPPGRKVWGDYCEYDDSTCPVSPVNEKVCSGSEHGICTNDGVCSCNPGWQGEACQCTTDQTSCSPNDGFRSDVTQVCSGNGVCDCGKCLCNKTTDGEFYTGQYCEVATCKQMSSCVECRAFRRGPLAEEDCKGCILEVEMLDEIDGKYERTCSFVNESDCKFYFAHNRLDIDKFIYVGRKAECPTKPNVAAIAIGVIGAILGIGLLLLLVWKIMTTIYDKLEYARFLRERALAKWGRDDNPIYKRPTTVFVNPAYTNEN